MLAPSVITRPPDNILRGGLGDTEIFQKGSRRFRSHNIVGLDRSNSGGMGQAPLASPFGLPSPTPTTSSRSPRLSEPSVHKVSPYAVASDDIRHVGLSWSHLTAALQLLRDPEADVGGWAMSSTTSSPGPNAAPLSNGAGRKRHPEFSQMGGSVPFPEIV